MTHSQTLVPTNSDGGFLFQPVFTGGTYMNPYEPELELRVYGVYEVYLDRNF